MAAKLSSAGLLSLAGNSCARTTATVYLTKTRDAVAGPADGTNALPSEWIPKVICRHFSNDIIRFQPFSTRHRRI
jgi:hypothetical protein